MLRAKVFSLKKYFNDLKWLQLGIAAGASVIMTQDTQKDCQIHLKKWSESFHTVPQTEA